MKTNFAIHNSRNPSAHPQQRLRILVHHRIASRDGQAVHLEEMVKALADCGHEVKLIGPRQFARASFGSSSQFVDKLKKRIPNHLYQLLEIIYNVIAFFRLYHEARNFQPSFIYERFSLYLFSGIVVAKLIKVPLLLEINSPLFEERLSAGDMGFIWLGRECQKWIWKHADRLLPVTGVLANIIQAYDGESVDRIHVIPNGVSINSEQAEAGALAVRERLKLSGNLIIGFVGFVRDWNAVDRLLDFLQRNGRKYNAHLLIVGDGPARRSLESLVRSKDVSSFVTITGLISRESVGTYIGTFDIAVIPGVTPYSSPLKMFEYMELGRPIVAPSLPNIKEILECGQNALLFDPGAGLIELEECLLELCNNPELRTSLGSKARETIERRQLTWAGNAARVVKIAGEVL